MLKEKSCNQANSEIYEHHYPRMDRNDLENVISQQIANAIPWIVKAMRQTFIVFQIIRKVENNEQDTQFQIIPNDVIQQRINRENRPPSRLGNRINISQSMYRNNTDIIEIPIPKEVTRTRDL